MQALASVAILFVGRWVPDLVDIMEPEIDATIGRLRIAMRGFRTDPIAGRELSLITSVMSSTYKRHGSS